jgi:hypothetical protein
VAVRAIEVWQGAKVKVVEASNPSLHDGFHRIEPENGWRWTNGDGGLPRGLFDEYDGPLEIVLHVAGTTSYPLLA